MSVIYSKIKLQNKGFTLIEAILYITLLVLVFGVIINALIAVGGVYKNVKMTRELESSATIVMERMLREIRNASSVVADESVLGVSPGTLTIAGIDENLVPYKFTFNVSDGVIKISKDGDDPVALTSSSGSASLLIFKRTVSPNSEGVRIELEMSGSSGSVSKSEIFYGFSVLRGSY